MGATEEEEKQEGDDMYSPRGNISGDEGFLSDTH